MSKNKSISYHRMQCIFVLALHFHPKLPNLATTSTNLLSLNLYAVDCVVKIVCGRKKLGSRTKTIWPKYNQKRQEISYHCGVLDSQCRQSKEATQQRIL